MKVIFMGTPAFAVPTLKTLIENSSHQVVAVFTQTPKLQGRGLKITNSPIYNAASQYKIPIYTPISLKIEESSNLVSSINADIIVVVAYGFIIPETILYQKKYGCLNIHPSSLPRHRGAAPLQYTIMSEDKETSVCIMKMDNGLDTGDILLQESFPLPPRITLLELHDKCAQIGADLLIKTLDNIDNLISTPQKTVGVTHGPKLKKEDGKINWYDEASKIDCKIRALSPWPGVYFKYNGKMIKILEADYTLDISGLTPGTAINDMLNIACGNGTLIIKKLQQEGKKPIEVAEFLRGTNIPAGTILN